MSFLNPVDYVDELQRGGMLISAPSFVTYFLLLWLGGEDSICWLITPILSDSGWCAIHNPYYFSSVTLGVIHSLWFFSSFTTDLGQVEKLFLWLAVSFGNAIVVFSFMPTGMLCPFQFQLTMWMSYKEMLCWFPPQHPITYFLLLWLGIVVYSFMSTGMLCSFQFQVTMWMSYKEVQCWFPSQHLSHTFYFCG